MLVGLEGALWPAGASQRAATRPEFRQDAYESLTRVTSSPYFYLSSTDEFRPSAEDHPDAIPLPLVTLPQLINQRRAFAESIADPSDQKRLIEALESSANLLGSFQRQVSEAGLGAQWHRFKFDLLFARLNEWASEHGVAVSPTWYHPSGEHRRESLQQILATLSQFMSDQEIRSLNVPFRSVEALYRSLTKRTFQ